MTNKIQLIAVSTIFGVCADGCARSMVAKDDAFLKQDAEEISSFLNISVQSAKEMLEKSRVESHQLYELINC